MYKFTYDETLRKAQTVDVVWFNERKMPDALRQREFTDKIALTAFRDMHS